jgi:CPA2 family monovalent cation:H+ antiporter-2
MGLAGDFILIVLAGLVGAVAARAAGLPLLVGYVLAGIAVGPNTAGPTVVQIHDIEQLAEIGVALLLFALGLETSLRDLRPLRLIALAGGPIQIALTSGFGFLVSRMVMGLPVTEAIYIGALVSLSSTMVVLKTLSAHGTTGTLASRIMIALLVVQDLAVVPMLIVLPQLGDLASIAPRVGRAAVVAAVFLGLALVVGTRVLPALLRRLMRWGSRELFLVAVLAAGVGVGFATYQLGLSFALGAFVAGLVLSETELSHQALSDVVPLRDVFGLVFFVSVGMLFDPGYLVEHLGDVVLLVSVIVLGKAAICGGVTRAFGYTRMAPWIVGLGLCQIGEFSFVLARTGLTSRVLSADTYNLILTCTVISMALSPLLFAAAFPLGRAWAKRVAAPPPPPVPLGNEVSGHVVIAGGGRTGLAIAATLQAAGVPFVLVDLHHAALAEPMARDWPVILGDVASDDILRAAGVARARTLVVTVPDWNAARLCLERATAMNAGLAVVARATSERRLRDLADLGVAGAVQPEFEAGVEMARLALQYYQHDRAKMDELTSHLRQRLYDRLDEADAAAGREAVPRA